MTVNNKVFKSANSQITISGRHIKSINTSIQDLKSIKKLDTKILGISEILKSFLINSGDNT